MLFLRKKLRIRFSVRTLLAVTMVLGALLGLAGNEANRLRLHRHAVREVHELGGRYGSYTGREFGAGWGPLWCPVIHDSLYADYEFVWFTSTANDGLRDVDLAILKHFSRLRDLQIAASLVTDDAMIHLQELKSLRELTLYRTHVTGYGLRRLSGNPLEKLVLAGPEISDETLEALECFPDLRKLMIFDSSVTDAGLAHFTHVPNLQKLLLTDSPVCDSGMVHLAKLTQLYELDLTGLVLTDDGISRLASLPRLQYLYVADTSITEAGLLSFRNTRTLKFLCVGRQPQADILNTLTAALPGCQVSDAGAYRCMQGW
jgi:hypothetical protein